MSFAYRHALELEPVPIHWDAAISTQLVGGGRLIPLLILNCSLRPDIVDMIVGHRDLGGGEVQSGWVCPTRFKTTPVQLVLELAGPVRCLIKLEFELPRRGAIVDSIVASQGLYLQAGRDGDRLVSTMGEPRVLVEVPSGDFRSEWERVLMRSLVADGRDRGLSRWESKANAAAFLKSWRKFTSLRL